MKMLTPSSVSNESSDAPNNRRSWLITAGIGLAMTPFAYLGVQETIGLSDAVLRRDLHDLITKRFEKVIGTGTTFALPDRTIVDCKILTAEVRQEIIRAAADDAWPYYADHRRRSYRRRINDLLHPEAMGNWYMDTIVEHAVDARIGLTIGELLEKPVQE